MTIFVSETERLMSSFSTIYYKLSLVLLSRTLEYNMFLLFNYSIFFLVAAGSATL